MARDRLSEIIASEELCGAQVVSVTLGSTGSISVDSVVINVRIAVSVVYVLPPTRIESSFDPRTPLSVHLQQVDMLGFRPR